MHVTNYAKLLFFINNLLSLIISGTDVLCLEELKPDLMVRVGKKKRHWLRMMPFQHGRLLLTEPSSST